MQSTLRNIGNNIARSSITPFGETLPIVLQRVMRLCWHESTRMEQES